MDGEDEASVEVERAEPPVRSAGEESEGVMCPGGVVA